MESTRDSTLERTLKTLRFFPRLPDTRRLAAALLIFISVMTVTVYGLQLIGVQVLRAPPHQPKPSPAVQLFCQGTTLLNVTDPNPLLDTFNGTAVYGCQLSNGAVTPALQVVKTGTVNASFSLPTGVNVFLVSNPGTLGPLSQAQCATGILLNSNVDISLPVGSYSYCESFPDPVLLVPITVSWYQV